MRGSAIPADTDSYGTSKATIFINSCYHKDKKAKSRKQPLRGLYNTRIMHPGRGRFVLSIRNNAILNIKLLIMKRTKIIYWTTTIIIFLFEGVMPALTSQTELAKEGIRHLGYPAYFGTMLVAFKIFGVLALIIPQVPARIKEWAYAGFTFDFIAASLSHAAVDGPGIQTYFPLVFLLILAISYITWHKKTNNAGEEKFRYPLRSSTAGA
jgi:hypothetical protein